MKDYKALVVNHFHLELMNKHISIRKMDVEIECPIVVFELPISFTTFIQMYRFNRY